MNASLPTFTAAALAAAITASPASAQDAAGVYDFSTGEIQVTLGENLAIFGIGSIGSNLLPANFSTDNRVGVGASLATAQRDAGTIAFFDAGGGLPSGVFELGAIVKPGTPGDDLALQYQLVNGDAVPASLTTINVPEPASIALLGLGGVALLRRRRGA